MRKKVVKPDVLIFATGYKQEFPFLDLSYITLGEANLRNIWKSGDESVGFIGFVRPSFRTSTFSSTIQSFLSLKLPYQVSPQEPSHHLQGCKPNSGSFPSSIVFPTSSNKKIIIVSMSHQTVGSNTVSITNHTPINQTSIWVLHPLSHKRLQEAGKSRLSGLWEQILIPSFDWQDHGPWMV